METCSTALLILRRGSPNIFGLKAPCSMAKLLALMAMGGQYSAICCSGAVIAFDLLYLNGRDLRVLSLLERKAALKKLLRRRRTGILYLDHIESDGRLLFEEIVNQNANITVRQTDAQYLYLPPRRQSCHM